MTESIEKTLAKKVATKRVLKSIKVGERVAVKRATRKLATKKTASKTASKISAKTAPEKSEKKQGDKDLFQAYIDNIKKARLASQEIVSTYVSEDKSSLVINLIWEAIFDYFCRIDKEEISPSNLNTLAGVVQKLLSTSKDLTPKTSSASISAQALAEIEEKLNLL